MNSPHDILGLTSLDSPGAHDMSRPRYPARVILLGASNVSLALPLLVSEVRRRLSPPVQILVACGHGRSYGAWSYVLHYGLPGILPCGLWHELENTSAERTFALVADVGNDLIYGRPAMELASWVATALQRLSLPSSQVALTRLPLESALSIGPLRYHVTKQLLFPGPLIPWPVMQQRAREVDAALEELARQYSASTVCFPPHWFGPDRIHLRFDSHWVAWTQVFDAWGIPELPAADRVSMRERWKYLRLPAAQYRSWPRQFVHPQPCLNWPDGTTLSVY